VQPHCNHGEWNVQVHWQHSALKEQVIVPFCSDKNIQLLYYIILLVCGRVNEIGYK